MASNFDRWTILKLVELGLVFVCVMYKKVTDDEATRVFLYLQKISREWSLLNNITWGQFGASIADATFGGYLIITLALFIGRLVGELPTPRRIVEYIFLGIGSILFIALGSLSFAAIDSVPPDLVDNAAIVGTISLITAGLFLLDIGGPKAMKPPPAQSQYKNKRSTKPADMKSITQQVYEIEREIEKSERKHLESPDEQQKSKKENGYKNGVKNARNGVNGGVIEMQTRKTTNGYQQMRDDFPRSFGIYGKDVVDSGGNETDDTGDISLPPKMEPHSPVWSNIRKVYPMSREREMEEVRPPSRPGDPGYVQYTAQHWGESGGKTPRQSPTQV